MRSLKRVFESMQRDNISKKNRYLRSKSNVSDIKVQESMFELILNPGKNGLRL
jgi:hypothetical protein